MPFRSKAQQRFMFAAEARGELPEGTARRWAHETPSIKKLPEKVGGETLQEHIFSTRAKVHRHLKKTANYKLQGARMFRGLDVAIENKKGSSRKWYDPHGKESGSTYMHYDYGYIRLTEGTDGDHVDVYVGPNEDAAKVFIVNQMKKPDFKAFDEQKVMLGFDSADAAKKAYLRQYNNPKFFGSMKEMDFEEFKAKVLDKKNHGKKIASGDMLQYFADHPEKLREKRERDRKKTAVLHTADGAIFGGAAADSQVGIKEADFRAVTPGTKVFRKAFLGPAGAAQRAASSLPEIAERTGYGTAELLTGKGKGELGHRWARGAAREAATGAGTVTEALKHIKKAELASAKVKLSSDIVHVLREAGKATGGAARGFQWADVLPNAATMREVARQGGTGALWGGATGALGGLGYAGERGYKTKNYGKHVLRGAAGGALAGGVLGAASVPAHRLGKHLILSGAPLLEQAELAPKVLDAAGNMVHDFGEPLIRKAKIRGLSGLGLGVGSHVMQDPYVQAASGVSLGRAAASLGAKRDKKRKKEAAISPAVLSHLQHGAVGAGIGAVAGGVGGMAHAQPDHRGQGFLRGALVGAGLGAAGGAGVSAIKQHGAQQLASLRIQAGKAHQEATAAHTALQHAPTARNTAFAQTQHAAPVGAGTMAAKPGVVGGVGGAVAPEINTQGRAVMDPRAWGARTPPPAMPHDIATAQAASAGGRAEALRQAAERLGTQQQVMNRGINRAALTGAAVGTGLMGYMAVPKEYGGVGVAPKTASDDRMHTIADRLDDVGIGMLASPYIADAAAGGLKRLMLRGGRLGALAAEGHGVAEAVAHKLHSSPAVELGGLALVAPGVIHPMARSIDKALPTKPHEDVVKAAAEAGRVLANGGHKMKLSGLGRLALGLGAVGAAGATLYGGKKAIDATKGLATHHATPAQYVGVPPGMRPPMAAG